jgi:hypothetical protein
VPVSLSPSCFSTSRVAFGSPKSTTVIAHAPDMSGCA